jgi:NAD/NADP transhydrogenase alpha subunit
MMYAIGITAAVVALLSGALVVAVKVAAARGREIQSLSADLAEAREEIRQKGAYQEAREEARRNADEKKQSFRTGDDARDFGGSLGVLHDASRNKSGESGA